MRCLKQKPQVERRRAFTLFELLASVAIVTALAALLFGGLKMARSASERAICASNLRSIGTQVHAYAADNGGYLPPGSRKNMGGTFSVVLANFSGTMKGPAIAPDIFYCPANVRMSSPPAPGYPTGPSGRGYKGWSGYFLNYLINGSVFLITSDDITSADYVPDQSARVRLPAVQVPSKTVALMDLPTRFSPNVAPPTSKLAGRNYFTATNVNFSLGIVHNGLGNVLFVDGHVESFKRVDLPLISSPSATTTWWP
ncbi:MAG TPA: prepilin-type N-terminal cleavage/methylation domain-containing protein [Terrimicrobiaceae bacterium]|nr:prepilin-type N-terminal cleavage/methylation domain-containing protein [Terrimicrobiaceae bacterium]